MKNLTPYNEANGREIEMMVGKAMCAYANWHEQYERNRNRNGDDYNLENGIMRAAAYWSEYEATVRCIDMFVGDSLYAIQRHVTERAEAELLGR